MVDKCLLRHYRLYIATTIIIELFVASVCGQVTTSNISAMEADGVVPDIIDVVPTNTIEIKYTSNVEVQQGNELTPTQVKDPPNNVTFPADPDSLYTLVMIDPDAPSRAQPVMSQALHWLVLNVPGGNVSQGEVVTEYRGSGPPKDTGLHRYIFVVYKQPGQLTVDNNLRADNVHIRPRLHFKLSDFVKKHNLGQPVAGNFYKAQYDDYVPIARAKVQDMP